MTKDELQKHINLYRDTEYLVSELNSKYGINIQDSKNPNFYNNYNLIIHNLLVSIFGDLNVDLLEEYIFDQTNISFDELCQKLGINETN
jgi:hypothetical protein